LIRQQRLGLLQHQLPLAGADMLPACRVDQCAILANNFQPQHRRWPGLAVGQHRMGQRHVIAQPGNLTVRQDETIVIGTEATVLGGTLARLDFQGPGRNFVDHAEIFRGHADPRTGRVRRLGINALAPMTLQGQCVVKLAEGSGQLRLNGVAPLVEGALREDHLGEGVRVLVPAQSIRPGQFGGLQQCLRFRFAERGRTVVDQLGRIR